eukprot:14616-Heterococcus_DN1.PRE.14
MSPQKCLFSTKAASDKMYTTTPCITTYIPDNIIPNCGTGIADLLLPQLDILSLQQCCACAALQRFAARHDTELHHKILIVRS